MREGGGGEREGEEEGREGVWNSQAAAGYTSFDSHSAIVL